MNKILFLDLDGTVREPASGAKFINDPHDQKIIEGAKDAIAHYSLEKWTLISITNQGGVAAGHKSLESAILEQHITLDLVPELACIYFCPDWEGNICWQISREHQQEWNDNRNPYYGTYRKPGDGMLMLGMSDFAPFTENKEHWMIGDREEDALAAAAAGINFMWADVWRDRFQKGLGGVDLSDRHISRETMLKFLAT